MSIKLTPSTSIAAPLEYLHTKDTVTAIKGLVLTSAGCCFSKYDLPMPAIADLVDNTTYKNDFFSFILSTAINSTVTGTLIKINEDGTETPYIITDQTYGDFYDLNVMKSGVWGFKLLWRNVAALLDFGKFKFNITVSNPFARSIYDETTPCFDLMPWSCETEHETVRIETGQSGYIEDGFDFRGLSYPPSTTEIKWAQQIRLYGKLNRTFVTETDSIPDGKREERQIQTMNYQNWNLKLNFMSGSITNFLVKEMFLSNPIKLSDFNQFNVEEYRGIKVKYLSTEDPDKGDRNKREFYNVKFEDYKKANIKRHG